MLPGKDCQAKGKCISRKNQYLLSIFGGRYFISSAYNGIVAPQEIAVNAYYDSVRKL